jgi:hypothetical protein
MSKISVGNVNQIIKNSKQEDKVAITVPAKDKTYDIEFKTHLTLHDEELFVKRVVGFSFEQTTGEYLSAFNELGKYVAVLQYMTNVDIPTFKDKKTIDCEKTKEFVDVIDLKEKIHEWFILADGTPEQRLGEYIYELFNMADNEVEFIKQQKIHKSSMDNFFDGLTNVVEQYGDKLNGLDINNVLDVFNKVKNMDESKFVTAIVDKAKEYKKESKDNITKLNEVKTK